jgi:hypothetical protein
MSVTTQEPNYVRDMLEMLIQYLNEKVGMQYTYICG